MRGQRGVSSIELIAALAIAGLVLVMGLPAFRSVKPRLELSLTSDQLLQDLSLARLRAIERRTSVRLSYSVDDPLRYTLSPYRPTLVPTPTPWYRRDIPKSVSFTVTSWDVTFDNRGFLDPRTDVELVMQGDGDLNERDGDAGQRAVRITAAGRIRVVR